MKEEYEQCTDVLIHNISKICVCYRRPLCQSKELSAHALCIFQPGQVILVVSTCGLGEFPANCKQTWMKLQSQE